MNFVVLDIELTQNQGSVPKIIQIGAAKMNTQSSKEQTLAIFTQIANPGELPDFFITELTGITSEEVQAADPLEMVLRSFWGWFQKQESGLTIFQWGGGDLEYIIAASHDLGVEIPKKIKSFDIKQFCGPFRMAKKAPKRGGLLNSMGVFGLEFKGRQHDALNDAIAAGTLFNHLCGRIRQIEKMEELFKNHS